MTVLNLRDGLEAFYTFGTDNFNDQANHIRDLSGYGRHAEASGGPSVGADSYQDFGATSFDGTDDWFDVPDLLANKNQFTLLAITANGSGGFILDSRSGSDGMSISSSSITVNDDSGEGVGVSGPQPSGFFSTVGRYDGEELSLILDGVTQGVKTTTYAPYTSDNVIGKNDDVDGSYFDGDLAVFGAWSRALSDAEIAQLNRLTGPMEARL